MDERKIDTVMRAGVVKTLGEMVEEEADKLIGCDEAEKQHNADRLITLIMTMRKSADALYEDLKKEIGI